jgi:nucleotide sugar dehydrogenase
MKNSKSVAICQIGLGFVGSAVLKALVKRGYQAVGVDILETRLAVLTKEGYKVYLPNQTAWHDADVFFLSVNTPYSDDARGYDLVPLKKALGNLAEVIARKKERKIIVIRSTISVGTTANELIPMIESVSGKKSGKDFGVVYNPEFLEEVNADHDALYPCKVVYWASDTVTAKQFSSIMETFEAQVNQYQTPELAESHKIMNNLLNACTISFFNEWYIHINKLTGMSAEALQDMFYGVCDTAFAKTRNRYGAHIMGAWGGSCLPKEISAALAHASQNKLQLPLTHAVNIVNERIKEEKDICLFAQKKYEQIKVNV